MNYHVGRAGQQLGVYPEETIRAMLQRGELRADDLGWCEGQTDWQPLGQLFPAIQPPTLSTGSSMPPSPPAFGAPRSFGGSRLPPSKPDSNLVPAILVTLFCCLPFGIASIVYASQVDSKYSAGDYDGAAESAAKSKFWMWWALGVGFVGGILWFIVSFMAGMAGRH